MDRDPHPLSQRHRPVSPSHDVDDNSRHRPLEPLSSRSPNFTAVTPPDFHRERLPPILDRPARLHQHAVIDTNLQRTSDVVDNRSPAGMVSAGYSYAYRSPETGIYASSRPSEPYRHDATTQQATKETPSESQPQRNPDATDSSGTYRVKRPRVSLACLFCRNRKSRCDGVRPTCKTCAHMSMCPWQPALGIPQF